MVEETTEDREQVLSQYREEGRSAGHASGSWVIDGNTTDAQVSWILRGINDCDPEVMDLQPSPLSGEWAGESMPELLGEYADDEEVQDAYEEGFSEGFWGEVERAALYLSQGGSQS